MAAGGLQTLAGKLSQNDDAEAQKAALLTQGRLLGLRDGMLALQNLPASVPRDEQLLSLLQGSGGLLTAINWIDEQLAHVKADESQASFDSELSLLVLARV